MNDDILHGDDLTWISCLYESYREALRQADPIACENLDLRVAEYEAARRRGRIKGAPEHDRKLSAKEAAYELGITVHRVYDWARRHPDLIPKYREKGKVLFLLSDLVRYRDLYRKKNQHQ